jgi:formyltetrahydrofolate synthetase
MGLVAVARDLGDLRERLGGITVGQTLEGEPVTAGGHQGGRVRWPSC